jgi:hypothetical protein
MKKRKLGSKNPKYKKEDLAEEKANKTFVQEVKGVKVYTIKYDSTQIKES